MYIQTDINRLGDKIVSKPESLRKLYEETESAVAGFRSSDHEHLKDEKARAGKRLSANEFIYKLRRLMTDLVIRDGNLQGCWSLYQYKHDKILYLGAINNDYLPEFTTIYVDSADLMKSAAEGGVRKGWRAVLVQLIDKKAISWDSAIEEFGDAIGESAHHWRKETQRFRNPNFN